MACRSADGKVRVRIVAATVASSYHILGFSFTMSVKWNFLRSVNGVDFARLMSKNMMIMMAGRILTAPLVTQLSNVFGR